MAGIFEDLMWKMSGGMRTVNYKYKSGKLEIVYDHLDKSWKLLFYLVVSHSGAPVERIKLDPSKLQVRCQQSVIRILYKDKYSHGQPMYYVKPLESDSIQYKKLGEALTKIMSGQQVAPVPQGTTPLSEKHHGNTNVKMTGLSASTPKAVTPRSKDTGRISPIEWDVRPLPKDMETTPTRYSKSAPSSTNRNFLQSGQDKSQGWLDTALSSGGFYKNSTPGTRMYGLFSTQSNVNKRPGLLPTPTPKRIRTNDGSTNYTWSSRSPSVPSERQTTLQGFSNLGNTCYMNAILQALFGLDCFTTDLMLALSTSCKMIPPAQRLDYLCFTIGNLVRAKRSNNILNMEQKRQMLSNVKKAISSSAKRFSGNNQHDAHEFLSLVLDQCKEEIIKIGKEMPEQADHGAGDFRRLQEIDGILNPTKHNFEMEVEHTFTCQICAEAVAKQETFHDLSLDVPRNRPDVPNSSIQDALDKFFLRERIEYTCEKCQGKEAEVTHSFVRLPRVLVLHLKRYSFLMGSASHGKLGRSIVIPKFLTLTGHCTDETSPPHPPEDPSIVAPLKPPPSENGQQTGQYKTPSKSEMSAFRSDRSNIGRPNTEPKREVQKFKFRKSQPLLKRRHSDQENQPKAGSRDLLDLVGEISGDNPVKRELTEDEQLQVVMEMSLVESKKSKSAQQLRDLNLEMGGDMSEDDQLKRAMELSMGTGDELSTNEDAQIFEPANQDEAMEGIDSAVTHEISYTEEPGTLCTAGNDSGCSEEEVSPAVMLHGIATIQRANPDEECQEAFELHYNESAEAECMAGNDLIEGSSDTSDTTDDEELSLLSSKPAKKVPSKVCVKDDKPSQKAAAAAEESVLCEFCGMVSTDNCCDLFHENAGSSQSDCDYQLDGTVDHKPSLWSTVTDRVKQISSKFLGNKSEEVAAEAAADSESDVLQLQDQESERVEMTRESGTDPRWDMDSPGTDYNKENHSPPAVKLQKFDTIDLEDASVAGNTSIVQPQQTEDEALKQAIENSLMEQELNIDPDEAEQIRKATELSLQELNLPFGIEDEGEEDQVPSPVLHRTEEEDEAIRRNAETGELPFSYQLVSVVSHLGNSSSLGHYISDVYDVRKKNWHSYDDSHVTSITEDDVRSTRDKTGYIFFYINRDTLEELEDYISLDTDNKTSHHHIPVNNHSRAPSTTVRS